MTLLSNLANLPLTANERVYNPFQKADSPTLGRIPGRKRSFMGRRSVVDLPPMMLQLLIAWGVVVALLIILLIYRSTLVMHEDDQLFLAESEQGMKADQEDVHRRMSKIAPYVRIAQICTAALSVLIVGDWLWDAFKRF